MIFHTFHIYYTNFVRRCQGNEGKRRHSAREKGGGSNHLLFRFRCGEKGLEKNLSSFLFFIAKRLLSAGAYDIILKHQKKNIREPAHRAGKGYEREKTSFRERRNRVRVSFSGKRSQGKEKEPLFGQGSAQKFLVPFLELRRLYHQGVARLGNTHRDHQHHQHAHVLSEREHGAFGCDPERRGQRGRSDGADRTEYSHAHAVGEDLQDVPRKQREYQERGRQKAAAALHYLSQGDGDGQDPVKISARRGEHGRSDFQHSEQSSAVDFRRADLHRDFAL